MVLCDLSDESTSECVIDYSVEVSSNNGTIATSSEGRIKVLVAQCKVTSFVPGEQLLTNIEV